MLFRSDYHLDGETGLDLIRKLRSRFGEAIPAVLVTADRSNEVREAADLMDVSVINKPLKPAVLVLARLQTKPKMQSRRASRASSRSRTSSPVLSASRARAKR